MMYQIKPTNNKQWWLNGNFFKILFVSLIAITCFFVFNSSSFGKTLASSILTPFFRAGNYFYENFLYLPKIFSDKNAILEKNKELANLVESLRIADINYQSVKIENEQLRKELGLKPSKDSVAASIVARPPQVPLDSLIIDKGSEDMINNGDFVLANGRVLIGRVAKTFANSATVSLGSFPSAVSSGFMERTLEPLEIKGAGVGGMQVKVPIDFDILVGDKVIIGNSLNYIVAVVGVIETNNSSGFKDVLLSLPVDVSRIQIVFVEPFVKQ